jgi:hypothetical protein
VTHCAWWDFAQFSATMRRLIRSSIAASLAGWASAGAGSDYSVAPLFSAAAETRFAAILKEVPQNG